MVAVVVIPAIGVWVLWRELRSPADLERSTRAPGGSIYGSSSNGARAAFQRPANQSPIPDLYLVGGSAHPGPGMPMVLMSGWIAADSSDADCGGTVGSCVSVQRRWTWRPLLRTRIYRAVTFVGRWSMLDIFVVTVLLFRRGIVGELANKLRLRL